MRPPRSTLRLLERLTEADQAVRSPILVGNTGDLLVDEDGTSRRLPYQLAVWAARRGRATVAYSTIGARQLTPPGCESAPLRLPAAESSVAQAVEELLNEVETSRRPIQLVVDYADLALLQGSAGVPEQGRMIELLAEFASATGPAAHGHRLAVIARAGSLDDRLSRLPGFVMIDVEAPDLAERLRFVERLADPTDAAPLRLEPDFTVDRLASLSGGLMLDDLLRGRDQAQHGPPMGPQWVQSHKLAALRRLSGGSLTVYPPGDGFNAVAGLPQVQLLIKEARISGRMPRRILLAGPPGVGKTLVVTAIADELGVPAVALGAFRSMWVGESERNIRTVLALVQSLAPCVLHIDEIDQSIGQRQTGQSADGGTNERVLADLWQFLGDSTHSEHVVVVGTTNRPELLDAAMFDRFTVIPVLHPTPVEAARILHLAAEREDCGLDQTAAIATVERLDRLVTGRLLVDVLDRAITIATMDGSPKEISTRHLDAAFADLMMGLDPEEHEYLALRAIALTTFSTYLPWIAAGRIGQQAHIPSYLVPLLDDSGRLDAERFRLRLNELAPGHVGR